MDANSPQRFSKERLRVAKREAKQRLLAVDGVRGVGLGEGTVRIYVRDAAVAQGLPVEVDGVPVECIPVGDVIAYWRNLEFVYVGDPMCSWCWAFAPALEKLEATYGLPVRTVMGGLRTGPQANEMDAAARAQLAQYWDGVAQRSGQQFTNASTQRAGWRYDTEPSCRAVVALRELAPEQTLRWVARLHRAFYVEGIDITDPSVFPTLLEGLDVDPVRYAEVLDHPETHERTRQDFAEAQRYGVGGFPTLLFRDEDELGIVTRGFAPWAQLEPALSAWLEDRYGDLTAGLTCDPAGGPC